MGLRGRTCDGRDIPTKNEEGQGRGPGEEQRAIAEASRGWLSPRGPLQIPGAASRAFGRLAELRDKRQSSRKAEGSLMNPIHCVGPEELHLEERLDQN